MNQIEKMHLDAIDSYTIVDHDVPIDVDSIKAASKSAMVTEQIAIEFSEWQQILLFNKNSDWLIDKTTKELFQEFLKTKEQ